MLGILLIDKPKGLSSHDVVNRARRVLGTKRVGHAGTLDPLATGLLVLAVGPATRFLQYLPLEPKVYVAEIAFGQSSTTYDAEGELSEPHPLPSDLPAAVADTLPQFLGLIQQLPPMYSAVKVKGQPLYKYARAGVELERELRTIHVESFDIVAWEGSIAKARIVCSGGTYIRTLAHDLGAAVGCGAYLSSLRRTDVGRFSVSQAASMDQIEDVPLMPLHESLPPMPVVALDSAATADIREGRAIAVDLPSEARQVALADPNGNVFSVARVEGNLLKPECVIPAEVLNGHV